MAESKAVNMGLTEHKVISENESALGLDRTGKDQKPSNKPSESVSKGGKSFKIK